MDYPAEYMSYTLRVDTRFIGWRAILERVLSSMQGTTYKVDGEKGIVQLTGRIDPRQLMKTLAGVGLHADLSPADYEYQDVNYPFRHGYDHFQHHGSYVYDPYGYGRPDYYHGYPPPPPQGRNWQPIYENYPHFLRNQNHQYQHHPYYEPPAQFFPQGPPPPEGFRNGDPEWCSIM